MREVVRLLDEKIYVDDGLSKTDTARARLVATDLLLSRKQTNLILSREEWGRLLWDHIHSSNIRTARKQFVGAG